MSEQKMWRVRDIREELSRRLGRPVSTSDYKYWQKLGLAPKTEEKSDDKYGALWTTDEVEQIIRTIMEGTEPVMPHRRIRYRRPGYWRVSQFHRELERRLGWRIPKRTFFYLRKQGVIPEPALRIPRPGGGWLSQYAYSDQQLEETVAHLASSESLEQIQNEARPAPQFGPSGE